MKKRQLRNISSHFDKIPLQTSSLLFDTLAQTLAARLYELYRDTVSFSAHEDRAITYVSCDVARLFVCLRLILDSADEMQPIRVHLSLDDDDSASLSIAMHKARELPERDLGMIAILAHLHLRINDEGVYIRMQAKREQLLHLFALDPVSLRGIFKEIDRLFDQIPDEM